MASRLAKPGVVGFLSALKGATGAMVSERDRRRTLNQNEADRSRAFNDRLALMSTEQQMNLATAQQTDQMREESMRRGEEWKRGLPPTPEEQQKIEESRAQADYYRALSAGIPQKQETAEDRAQAALDARVASDREQLERTAMMAPDPEDGIAYLKAGAKLIGPDRVAELTAILKEKAKQQKHQADIERARGILTSPTNLNLGPEDQKKVAKGFGLSDAELFQITGQGQEYTPGYQPEAMVDVTPTPAVAPRAPSGPSDADLMQMRGGATNQQEARDWQAQGVPGAPAVAPAAAAGPRAQAAAAKAVAAGKFRSIDEALADMQAKGFPINQ